MIRFFVSNDLVVLDLLNKNELEYLIVYPKDFKRWRKNLKLSQKEAADLLGLKPRMVQYYERGERDGKKVNIPKAVRLACNAILIQRVERLDPHLFTDLAQYAHAQNTTTDRVITDILRTHLKATNS